MPDALPEPLDRIVRMAAQSDIADYDWPERGIAPLGYIKGMSLVFARVYCKLLRGDRFATEIAKADTEDSSTDALSHYADRFARLSMDNKAAGAGTLRHVFVLLLGLGMRESSGRWCEGRDRDAHNITADTAEAGLFQTSWDIHSASPLLPLLFHEYTLNPSGFLDLFQEGVVSEPADLEIFGSGDGSEFQILSRKCPAFAAEFAAVGLRNDRAHWGPINRHAAELRREADALFLGVQQVVDKLGDCSVFLIAP